MLSTQTQGLSAQRAAALLAEFGPNRVKVRRARPWWQILITEMVHFFALLFWAAGALAFVAGLPQLGVAIFGVVLLNGLFAFAQEERAEHAAEKLRRLLPSQARVLRDGALVTIPADDLVPGDAMVLAEGDRISADAEITGAAGLAVDTSAMTGESVPEHPMPGQVLRAGCFVIEGEATAIVTATGAAHISPRSSD